jgi:hypothetical protein
MRLSRSSRHPNTANTKFVSAAAASLVLLLFVNRAALTWRADFSHIIRSNLLERLAFSDDTEVRVRLCVCVCGCPGAHARSSSRMCKKSTRCTTLCLTATSP